MGKHVVGVGESLAELFPNLASQWHPAKNSPSTPDVVKPTQSFKAWWICDNGHEWEALISNRSRGSGCPYCSGNRILAGFNDLATLRPDVAKTWSKRNGDLFPTDVGVNSHRKVWWLEPCGHEFEMSIPARTRRPLGCKLCSGHSRAKGINDLATSNPELILEWDVEKNQGMSPDQFQSGSREEIWWKGSTCGHSWQSRISSRTRKNPSGCPVCRNLKVLPGFNDLKSLFPEIAEEFDFSTNQSVTPENVVAGSDKPMSWLCPSGHRYQATPYSRTAKKTGCPVCRNLTVIDGENDLATHFPEIAAEWDYNKNPNPPNTFSFGSHSKAWFVCTRNHSYQTVIRKRTEGNSCPFCGNKKLLQGFNDLATLYPQIANQWDQEKNNRLPSEVMAGSMSKAWFKCELGHSYETLIQSKSRGETGCPICGNFQLLRGFNDLETRLPQVAMEWHPTKNGVKQPTDFVFGSHSFAWFVCYQGHEWRSTIVGRQKSGCPSCAEYGFKPHKAALFYFIENEGLSAKKVGITNSEERRVRLNGFAKRGWKEVLIVERQNGEEILALEKAVLTWIRKDLSIPSFLTSKEMGRQGGWTETFAAESLSNQAVTQKIMETMRKLGIK